jgi:hypothetical protein
MTYFLTAFLLLAGFLFWGAGLAFLVTPARYRRFSFIFAAPVGVALQSLVVWVGAHAGFRGTDAYGRFSLILPVLLLLVAWWCRRVVFKKPLRFGALLALMTMQLSVMIVPFALSGRSLTTVSIGSFDAPDYGAGARVLQEFARNDRSGFLGQTEVVSVGVVDNFFDFWLRTNHFTPSALIALNGSIMGLKPYQLTGLVTIVLLTATLPMVFWLARAGLRYRPWPSFAITAIYAFSPINWYAVYNVSPAQLVAANAIALLTWCGIALWREGARLKGWRWTWLLIVSYGLIFGGYNFIIVVSLVPALAYSGGLAIWTNDWSRLMRWLAIMLAALILAGLIYLERGMGVIERIFLFNNGYGWTIPLLTPEGWVGLIDGPGLTGYSPGWRVVVGAIMVGLIIVSMVNGMRCRSQNVFIALGLSMPILFGYWYLQLRSLKIGPSASYEAYKLFAVFYPGMLAAFCFWGDHWFRRNGLARILSAVGLVFLIAWNVIGDWRFSYRLHTPPFWVDEEIEALGKIEQMPEVASVNMRLEDGWARLWANALLLKKHQYFEIHSYEGRMSTALLGDWDLLGDFFHFDLPKGDSLHSTNAYTLMRRRSPFYIEGRFAGGWAESIRDDPRPTKRSHWASEVVAGLRITNPQPVALTVGFSAALRSLSPRECQIRIGGTEIARLVLTESPQVWTKTDFVLPPGETLIEFSTPQLADFVGGRLKRPVTFAVDGVDVRVLGRVDGSSAAQ